MIEKGSKITNSALPLADIEDVESKRAKLARLYTFVRRHVSKTFTIAKDSHLVMGLFSDDGILLDLFAREDSLVKSLIEDGIQPCSNWSQLGYNAVTEGLKNKKDFCSVGEENADDFLKKYALYLSPINMLSIYEPYEPTEQCGLAIIVPKEYAWSDYLTMIASVAHDMMITIQFNNIATMYYERSGKGLLSIDNMMSEKNLVTYYNEELFRVLGVKHMDIYHKPAELLIDSLPANEEFWSVLNEHKTISNYPITVQVRGKEIECIASTDAFNQPSIKAHGVTFYLTTPQRMTANLSEKMSNGAIKTFEDIISEDAQLQGVKDRARQMATTSSNVMILGESGTGKDVFAQAIHNASCRSGKSFIALNCGAMPRDLIESELFGYETGAFTGAKKNGNIGKFELANGGTIFLDEIGEMPLDLQSKLLRVVENKQIMRLGGNKMISVDVKIIAATNANIWEMIEQKKFRADLFYRLSTMRLNLPPLRERKGDIIPLAEFFIRNISKRIEKKNIMRFSQEAKTLLLELPWYGNVRELQNLMECIVQLYPGDIVRAEYILDNVTGYQKSSAPILKEVSIEEKTYTSVPELNELNRETIINAIEACGWNRSKTADYLGISRRTLYRRMDEFGIPKK